MGRLEANLRAKMAPSWILEASWEGLGVNLGRLETKLRAKMAPSWVPRWKFWGSKNEARGPKRKVLGPYAKLVQRLRTIIFPIDFNGFLRFRGSMLEGKIDLGVSWRPLRASWRRLKASWRPLGAFLGDLGGI